MKRTTLTNHIKAFKDESLMLLRFQLASDRLLSIEKFKRGSRADMVDTLIAIKAIENDMLIRICKFDDDTKGVHSLKKALLEITALHKNYSEIKMKVSEFVKLIKEVKEIRRHTQLAHLKIGSSDRQYKPEYDFLPAIKMIVDIVDLMNEKKIEYRWNDGSFEKYDLRKEVLGEG